MPVGFPTLYRPEYCQIAIEEMYNGHSIAELAHTLKVSRKAIYEWKKKHPEFDEAIKKGIEFSEGWWMKQGTANIHNKHFNSVLWYMNMKNRFHWSDKTEQQINISTHEDSLKELDKN